MTAGFVSKVEFRVRYAETDQMGVAHHANYLIWCEFARTEHMRSCGASYRELERGGLLLPVVEATVRFLSPARYEDAIVVRCWVRNIASRKVTFGYAVEHAEEDRLLATAQTGLIAVNSEYALTTIPVSVRQKLVATRDPVRL